MAQKVILFSIVLCCVSLFFLFFKNNIQTVSNVRWRPLARILQKTLINN